LSFRGAPDGKYSIEASTNLVNWEPLGPASNQNGRIEFTDNDAPKFVLRFYRAQAAR
jgi:hypothetical protein